MIEETFGTGFACAPALRQLYSYYRRTGSLLPEKDRQRPNEDFLKMRRKINIRDIFWYRKAVLVNGRVREAFPIFQRRTTTDTEGLADTERLALQGHLPKGAPPVTQKSVVDWWEGKIKRVFRGSSSSQSSEKPHICAKCQKLDDSGYSSRALFQPDSSTIADNEMDSHGRADSTSSPPQTNLAHVAS